MGVACKTGASDVKRDMADSQKMSTCAALCFLEFP